MLTDLRVRFGLVARRLLGTWAVDYGCEYCADDGNRSHGHVTQVATDDDRGFILLRCPRCGALYENTAGGFDETRRLTESEARRAFPAWTPSDESPGRWPTPASRPARREAASPNAPRNASSDPSRRHRVVLWWSEWPGAGEEQGYAGEDIWRCSCGWRDDDDYSSGNRPSARAARHAAITGGTVTFPNPATGWHDY